MLSLKNKVVLITGASSGIGKSSAEQFAAAGANLILTARRVDRIEKLATDLKAQYQVDTLPVALDVRDAALVEKVIKQLPAKWRDIDVLLNNAGLALSTDKMQEADIKNWDTMIDTNIKGLLYVTRAIIPQMLARNSGHVINIGSIAGHECYAGGNVYSATKHAVKALSKSLRIDLLGTDLRVSCVDPGLVHTEFSAVRWDDAKRGEDFYADCVPLAAEDIADAVVYCATRPLHVNVEDMVVMPTHQPSTHYLHRANAEKNDASSVF